MSFCVLSWHWNRLFNESFMAITLCSNYHAVENLSHAYIINQIQRKRNYLNHFHKDHQGDQDDYHWGCHGDHHINQYIYGDNAYHYLEDHLSLYLHFYHFFSVGEKGNIVDLLGLLTLMSTTRFREILIIYITPSW